MNDSLLFRYMDHHGQEYAITKQNAADSFINCLFNIDIDNQKLNPQAIIQNTELMINYCKTWPELHELLITPHQLKHYCQLTPNQQHKRIAQNKLFLM